MESSHNIHKSGDNVELICYAIIPFKSKEIKFSEFDASNQFENNAENVICITNQKSKNNLFDGCKNLLILNNVADIDSFKKRLKFCWNLLFRYR